MPSTFKCFHSCCLESKLCQLAVLNPQGLLESREINYKRTQIRRYSFTGCLMRGGADRGSVRVRACALCACSLCVHVCAHCVVRQRGLGLPWWEVCHLFLTQMTDVPERPPTQWVKGAHLCKHVWAVNKTEREVELIGICVCTHQTELRATWVQACLSPAYLDMGYLGKGYLGTGIFGAGQ